MTVVWHDRPGGQQVPLTLKMMKPVLQVVGPSALPEMTDTVSLIEPAFRPTGEFACVFFPVFLAARFGVFAFPFGSQAFQKVELFLG